VQNGVIGPAQATLKPEFHAAASARIPNIRGLLDAFRAAHLEVIYTIIENLTEDGRDRSLDYKLSSFNIAKGSWEAHTIDEIAPQSDEIVLRKTSSSAFNSTSLDYLLRNIGIEDLLVAGFMTDQCIDHAVKDGADLGYCDQMQPARRVERGDGAAQKLARAALPGAPISLADVAEDEMFWRRAISKIDAGLGAHIRNDHEIAAGAEGRVEDRPERRLHHI
jgi:Isochorismatase family